jgi:hypothetical protein
MADEFLTLLSDYSQLGANYCVNAKKLAPDTDYQKLLSVYESGLNGCLSGISKSLGQQYSALPEDEKAQLNQTVQLSGVLPMLKTANEKIGANSIGTVAVLKLALDILLKIEKLLLKVYPQAGGPLTLFGWKDIIIENIRNVLAAMSGDTPAKETAGFPPTPAPRPPQPGPGGSIAPVTPDSLTQPPVK